MERHTSVVLEQEGESTDLSLLFSITGSFAKTVKSFAPSFNLSDELINQTIKKLVMDNNFEEIVGNYVAAGYKVFPIDGVSKAPAKHKERTAQGIAWRTCETQEPEELMANFYDYPATSVALAMGIGSDGTARMECIDVDTKHDKEGSLWKQVKKCLVKTFGKERMPYVIQRTQSGGYHVIYRCAEVIGNKKIASRPGLEGEQTKKVALVESRGYGGYIAISPSAGYQVIYGDIMEIPEITTEERQNLWELLRGLDQMPKPAHKPRYNINQLSGPAKMHDGESAWDAYNESADVVGLLEKHGWKISWAKTGKTLLTRPGKSVGTSAEYDHNLKKLFCFTTSTVFDSEQPYDPYEIYTILEYGGDFNASAKALYHDGYGKRRNATDRKVEKIVEAKVVESKEERQEWDGAILITTEEHEDRYSPIGIPMVVFQEESIDLTALTDKEYSKVYLLLPEVIQEEVARRVGRHRCYKINPSEINPLQAINFAEEYPIAGLTTADKNFNKLYDRLKNGVDKGVPIYGIPMVDSIMRFNKKGTLTCVTGTPGAGKSNFVDVLSACCINELGWKIGFFSAEAEIDDHTAGVLEKMYRTPFEKLKEDEFVHGMEVLTEQLFYINSIRGEIKTVEGLIETATEAVLKHGIDMLVVDNMSLVDRSGKDGSQMRTNIGGILAKFISFASKYGVKVFLVVHPRKMSKRMDGSYGDIEGYDLAESAEYFNLSDRMISVERSGKGSHDVKIRIIKNRNKHTGKLGEVELRWKYNLGGCYEETGHYVDEAESYRSKVKKAQSYNDITQKALDIMNK